jgi:hypothetical protein
MSETQDTERIRISQVAASALAAVTAALLGSTMGVAGTVIGAGVASVVSTVGGVLYLRSIQRTRDSMLLVRSRVVARAGSTTVTVTEPASDGKPSGDGEDEEQAQEQPRSRRRTVATAVVGSLVAFVLGMAVVTGMEWLRGEPFSGGEGTTLGEIVQPRHDDGRDQRKDSPPATGESTSPSTVPTETVTVTPTPPLSGETTSEQPPSGSSTQETTTTGPPTSGSASVPPTG